MFKKTVRPPEPYKALKGRKKRLRGPYKALDGRLIRPLKGPYKARKGALEGP